jgi:hypothetical protein
MEFPIALAVLALLVLLTGLVVSLGGRRGSARVQTRRHGELEGRPVALHTLGNALGLTAQVSELSKPARGKDNLPVAGQFFGRRFSV